MDIELIHYKSNSHEHGIARNKAFLDIKKELIKRYEDLKDPKVSETFLVSLNERIAEKRKSEGL